jgi:hypothetical protein
VDGLPSRRAMSRSNTSSIAAPARAGFDATDLLRVWAIDDNVKR